MKLSKEDLEDLAMFVKTAIINEFAPKHLSRNLMDTIEIRAESEDKIQVVINAETYKFFQFFMHGGVVIPDGKGSYASKLNDEGSSFVVWYGKSSNPQRRFVEPRNHIGYLDRVINKAMDMWLVMKANKYEFKTRTEV